MSRDEGKVVLWPAYFDSHAVRPLRRVPKGLAVAAPTADEVARAVQALRMPPILERDIPHPARPWAREGRVLVDARGSKSVLVRQVAEKIAEARKATPEPAPQAGRKGK